jgi:hypothetical protein
MAKRRADFGFNVSPRSHQGLPPRMRASASKAMAPNNGTKALPEPADAPEKKLPAGEAPPGETEKTGMGASGGMIGLSPGFGATPPPSSAPSAWPKPPSASSTP